MATAFYLAAHGAHFPMVHTEPMQPASSPPTDPMLSIQHQAPHLSTAPTTKIERADSVISTTPHDEPTINSQETSLFFHLPAELRNQIYETLLCANTPSNLHDLPNAPRLPTPSPTHPAILSTCKRINQEATPLLYSTHIFHAHASLLTSLPHLTSPSHPILHPAALRRITRWQLTVRLDTDPRFSGAQAAAAFSGAEFFELRVWQSVFDGCGAGVLRLFTGVRGVGVCRVRGSVEEGLARWLERVMMAPLVEEKRGEGGWCRCQGERYVRCEGCEGRVWLDGNGAGVWMDEGDAWRFGNR
ncbi:hypothetical protein EKO04_001969 [Ascochyta lentis]|uniref:F-box domain-containing protein n=1 Tax=Ascochyta lentis TaxID=205686 RepID=A0A8H7MMN2_9PLEO|nr:hypothetical protein EKO04_001969 [Ascochyta lentis]